MIRSNEDIREMKPGSKFESMAIEESGSPFNQLDISYNEKLFHT